MSDHLYACGQHVTFASNRTLLPGWTGAFVIRTLLPSGGGEPVPTLVMLHPAYLLRQPLQKRLAWRDMLQLRAEMRAQGLLPAGAGGGGDAAEG